MVMITARPTYFASLVGAMMASTDIERGRALSSGMFSSQDHYQFLSKIFRPWRQQEGQHLSQKAKEITLDAVGLLFPWMNLLAGKLELTETRFSEVERLYDQLISELERRRENDDHENWEWDGFILDFKLRLGKHSSDLVPRLLSPFLPIMEEYHERHYLNYWNCQERQRYDRWLERNWLDSEYQASLRKGIKVLHQLTGRPRRSLPIRVA